MDNRILKISILVVKALQSLGIAFGVISVLVTIGYFMDFDFLKSIYVEENSDYLTFSSDKTQGSISLLEVNAGILLFWTMKYLLQLVLFIIILRVVLKVLGSIYNLETFYSQNIASFKKIALLFVIWWFMSMPIFELSDGEFTIGVSVGITYLIYALVALVLAEIFKEGNRLYEENKLTI